MSFEFTAPRSGGVAGVGLRRTGAPITLLGTNIRRKGRKVTRAYCISRANPTNPARTAPRP